MTIPHPVPSAGAGAGSLFLVGIIFPPLFSAVAVWFVAWLLLLTKARRGRWLSWIKKNTAVDKLPTAVFFVFTC